MKRVFFAPIEITHPEFENLFKKSLTQPPAYKKDLLQFLMDHSEFLQKSENKWMQQVIEVVRNTSIFFQPQIRTKIMNEGWASYWHETLFLRDDRIQGHEVDFARVNAGVTAMPRVGLNPYALGMRLLYYIEELAEKGKYSFAFQRLADTEDRDHFDAPTSQGKNFIFNLRENFCDFTFINTFVDQDFVTKHQLFVAGKRLNQARMVWEYYVKSRKVEDYRQMLLDALYHPPHIEIDHEKSQKGSLYLFHYFEGKPLVTEFIQNTMMGIEYLWDAPVHLETSEVVSVTPPPDAPAGPGQPPQEVRQPKVEWQRVVYTMENRKLTKKKI